MKQSEKILVYLVTGFLVVILVVAILFGNGGDGRRLGGGPANGAGGGKALSELLDNKNKPVEPPAAGGKAGDATAGQLAAQLNGTGLPAPGAVVPERPLVGAAPSAVPAAVPAAALLAERLGTSRVDGFGASKCRFVRVRSNDTLSSLVQKWCGSTEEYLEGARRLNEELVTLKVGSEVAVPYVADEVVLAAWQARQPKSGDGKSGDAEPATGTHSGGTAAPAVDDKSQRPNFLEPGASASKPAGDKVAGGKGAGDKEKGAGDKDKTAGDKTAGAKTATGGAHRDYTVKSGDTLWGIANREAGKAGAAKFVASVKELNPEVADFDHLRQNQKLKLPPAAK